MSREIKKNDENINGEYKLKLCNATVGGNLYCGESDYV